MNEQYYLIHGGPGSGRYPLGSGDRPYQKFEGRSGKKSGILGYIKSKRTRKLEESSQKDRDDDSRKKTSEEEKEKVLKSGTSSEILKYQGKLTNKELGEAAERIRLENQLKAYSEKEIKTALEKLKTVQSYTNVGSALARDGIDLWNSFASIYNVTEDGKKNPLPIIGKGGGDGKKK